MLNTTDAKKPPAAVPGRMTDVMPDERKVTFSQDLPLSTAQKFHEVAGGLPCLKWQVLQAMIWTFANLPRSAHIQAIAGNYDVRELLRIADFIEGPQAARKAADAESQARRPSSHKKGRRHDSAAEQD